MRQKMIGLAVVLAFFGLLTAASNGEWRRAGNVRIQGNLANEGTLTQTGNATMAGTLAVTGATTLTGAVTMSGGATTTGAVSATTTVTAGTTLNTGVSATVTAAGTDKTDCTALTKGHNVVSTATALQGVCLPAAVAGAEVFVYNATAVTVVEYPKDSDNAALTIMAPAPVGALATDAGWTVGPSGSMYCRASSATSWLCRQDLGARASVAAAGNGQASYQALASVNLGSIAYITASDGTKGITLPTGANLGCIRVINSVGTQVLVIDGHNSDNDTIDGGSADATITVGATARSTLCTSDGVAWLSY